MRHTRYAWQMPSGEFMGVRYGQAVPSLERANLYFTKGACAMVASTFKLEGEAVPVLVQAIAGNKGEIIDP